MNTLALCSAAFLFGSASAVLAFCPEPPPVLKPGPGQLYGCPVYGHTANGKFWFSDFVVPFDNNLYGFYVDAQFDDKGNVIGGALDAWMMSAGLDGGVTACEPAAPVHVARVQGGGFDRQGRHQVAVDCVFANFATSNLTTPQGALIAATGCLQCRLGWDSVRSPSRTL